MTTEGVTPECYIPMCSTVPRWRVSDLDGAGQLDVCERHLARLVERKLRRMDERTEDGSARCIVAPLFTVEDAADLAPLLAVGAEVYGLCANREIARLMSELDGSALDALLGAYGGREAMR